MLMRRGLLEHFVMAFSGAIDKIKKQFLMSYGENNFYTSSKFIKLFFPFEWNFLVESIVDYDRKINEKIGSLKVVLQ